MMGGKYSRRGPNDVPYAAKPLPREWKHLVRAAITSDRYLRERLASDLDVHSSELYRITRKSTKTSWLYEPVSKALGIGEYYDPGNPPQFMLDLGIAQRTPTEPTEPTEPRPTEPRPDFKPNGQSANGAHEHGLSADGAVEILKAKNAPTLMMLSGDGVDGLRDWIESFYRLTPDQRERMLWLAEELATKPN